MDSRRKETQQSSSPSSEAASGAVSSSIRRAIESQSRAVDLEQLARRKKTGRVVTMATLERIMIEAIENVLLQGELDPLLERDALREQTRQEFRKLLDSHQKASSERSEDERARESLEKQVVALKRELALQTRHLEGEKAHRELEVHLSESSLGQMEARLQQLLDQHRKSSARPRKTSGDEKPLRQLEDKLAGAIDAVLQQEKKRALASHQEVHDLTVDRLERRITKLNSALSQVETSLHSVLTDKDVDPGVASLYRTVQGLDGNDQQFARKRELIQAVFVTNLRMRQREVRPEDLEGVAADLLAPLKEDEKKQPDGETPFSDPVDPQTDETAF